MPSLSQDQIMDVRATVMERYSSIRAEIPMSKSQLAALLTIIDSELNTSEISIVTTVPAGDARDWLIANDTIGRDLMVETETMRRDVL